jgi:hypothetical protein
MNTENDPYPHTRKIKERLGRLAGQLRVDVLKVTAPKAQALLETAAEVLTGLGKAFSDYEKKSEAAWQADRDAETAPQKNFRRPAASKAKRRTTKPKSP